MTWNWKCCGLERVDINPNTQDKNGKCMTYLQRNVQSCTKNEIPGQNVTLLVTFAN